ncbi:hypothetical protein L6164_015259 [Bauhinia variegata]|uniref:Uncharacterized protein n=1 Tax=Bauhinia variegata TaxID=167791 RepID=A0ACB9NK11_BAUVA|nr:hypothetical protein L6164_015259 [Bauhinia variegata]
MKAVKAENGEKEKKSSGSTSKKATSANAKSQAKKVAKVKKEEPEADYSPKPTKAANSASRSKVKKEENGDYDENDVKPGAKRGSSMNLDKELKNKKKKKEEQPAAGRKKREKKVFDLPGQKRDPPEEKEALRIFYETLYKQIPSSEMAQVWMMECGLLPEKEAMKVIEKKQKKGMQHKVTSPVKAIDSVMSSTQSVTVKKKTSSPVRSAKKKTTDSTSKKRKEA